MTIKKFSQLGNVFKKIWGERRIKKENEEKQEVKKEKLKGYISPDNIVLIISKNKELQNYIETNFDVNIENSDNQKIPKLDYKIIDFDEAKKEVSCLYSVEFLKLIFELCKPYEKVKFKMKNNYPLWIETDDFICILAPRIEGEEE
jgi:hypothetical protein